MASHNRKQQLLNSLRAINLLKGNVPIEVIIVDDNPADKVSRKELKQFNFPVIYKIRKDRQRQDPVIPNNMAFDMAQGDVIIMSCAEILMVENVIKHAWENTTDKNYLCYGVYTFNFDQLYYVNALKWDDPLVLNKIKDLASQLSERFFIAGESPGWYIHTKHRPHALPFCSALTRVNMEKLSGYDERFQYGVGSADVDFLRRVVDLGLEVSIHDHPLTIHQPHQMTDYTDQAMVQLNLDLLNQLTATHNIKAENNIIYKR